MKKLFSVILAASLACSSMTVFADKEVTFSDISAAKYEWARPYIEEMARLGYIAGYEDDTYRPDNQVTKLETILLFARAMGAKEASNADVVEIALEQYNKEIEATGIRFGQEEVAYMLYRGALTKDDLKKFLSDGNNAKPMQRQEACSIITKAMCADTEAQKELLIDMDYTDAKSISSDYAQYVFYVSEKGIMNGMDDGTFAPEASVLRSQIAKMLYLTVDKMERYIETVLVPSIDTEVNNITILDSNNEEIKFGYKDTTKFFYNGKIIEDVDFINSSRAMLTYIDNALVFVDMYEKVVDETIKGVYQGATTEEGATTVTIKPDGKEESVEYSVLNGAELINIDGASVTFKGISAGSYVEVELTNDKIVKLQQIKAESFINDAIIESLDITDNLYLVISHENEEYDGMKFLLNDSVVVYKNDDIHDLSKLYKGDKVNISFKYGEVTKIKAYSNTKTYTGTISEIAMSATPTIKIKSGTDVTELTASYDVKVKVNGEAGTLYDLRIGDTIKAITESNNILSIETTTASANGNPITGVIETVNASRGFIKVNGEVIFFSNTVTIVTASGSTTGVKSLEEGSTVSVRGNMSNGAYTATLIIIE